MIDKGADEPPTASSGAPHLQPVDDAPPITLAPNHVEDLTSSGLDVQTVTRSGVYSEGKSKPIAELLGWGWRNGGGLVFPFVDYDSRKVLLCRVKPDRPRTRTRGTRGTKKKPIKYEQPPHTGAVPYFGPRCIADQQLDDPTNPVYWVEGEKKTLLLDQLGYTAIGITGAHTWNDAEKYRNGDGLTWSKPLRKYAERFIKGRHHVIAFDSDAFGNDNVVLAMRRLAGLLLDSGAASVHVVRVPPDPKDDERGVGIDDYFVEQGEEKTRAVISAAEKIAPGEDLTPIAPRDPLLKLSSLAWLKGAKLDPDLRLPPRFEIRRDRSLWAEPDKPDGDQKELMRSAVVPVRLLDALEGDEQRLEIAFYARGKWHRAIVDRKAGRDARRALAELPPGVAIDSNNAPLVVLWLGEYMRHNEHRMSTRRFASECGWQTLDDENCFLLDVPITTNPNPTIVADDSGDRSDILKALHPCGTYDAHLTALRHAFDEDPIAAVAILGALSAPLLAPLGAPNFAINFHGDSSKGKTTIVKVAASLYGNPSNEQWVGSWNATAVAMELRASTLCDLPLCFDEVGAGDMRVIERSIYMLVNGSGKSRGDRSLRVRRTTSWQTVVLSTGEHELANEKANTGAQVRVLQFRVSGFGSLDGAGVDAVRESCERNYAHVGRKWIETLVAIDDWASYVELFEKAKTQFRSRESGTLMQRQAVYYALLAVAEHLAHNALGFGQRGGATVRELFGNVDRRHEVQSASERAIEVVSEWIASEPLTFPKLDYNTSGALCAQTVAHVKRINGVRYKGHVCLLPNELRDRLSSNGISVTEAIASWHEAGWLDVDEGRKTKRMRWDGKRVRTIAVSCEALGLDEADSAGSQTNVDFSK